MKSGVEHVKKDLKEARKMLEFLVRRERKVDTLAEVATRRLERLEREEDEEDREHETNLEEALVDKTKVVKLVVDKWFVDRGFGFGKVHTGEIVFIHASAVVGAEVLTIGTDAWVQVVTPRLLFGLGASVVWCGRCAAWLALSGASAGGFVCLLVPTWVLPRWRFQACQCRRFVSPVSHVGLSTLAFAGVLWCSWISLASFSVRARDDHQEPQQVSQSSEEGRLSHVTDQHDCGVFSV